MPTKNGQFEYPEEGWSTGKMARINRPDLQFGRKDFMDYEGARKSKEQRISMLGESGAPPNWDDAHYSELERRIGTDQMQFIKGMDEHILKQQTTVEPYEGKGSKGLQNWLKMRQQYLDMFERPDSGVVNPKEKGLAQDSGKWETG